MGRAFEFRKARKMKRWSAMSKIFSRLNKDLIVAIREGGNADPESNSRLRAVLQNCKAANMPKDNIARAIKKATDKDTSDYKEVTFEGYGPHGIAVYVETTTDNNNRTVASIRSDFAHNGGNLGTTGNVEFLFHRVCFFNIQGEGVDPEELATIVSTFDNLASLFNVWVPVERLIISLPAPPFIVSPSASVAAATVKISFPLPPVNISAPAPPFIL